MFDVKINCGMYIPENKKDKTYNYCSLLNHMKTFCHMDKLSKILNIILFSINLSFSFISSLFYLLCILIYFFLIVCFLSLISLGLLSRLSLVSPSLWFLFTFFLSIYLYILYLFHLYSILISLYMISLFYSIYSHKHLYIS